MNKYYHVRRQGDDDYLQHWSLSGAHKYIAKIDLGGKFRYFYNQAEIEAYKAAKAAGNAVNNAYRVVRKGAEDAVNSAGRQISTLRRKAKHAVGLYAREDMNRKWGAVRSDRDPRSKAHSNKMNRWFEARKNYEKTPLGRLESGLAKARENAQQTWYRIEKKADTLGKNASEAVSGAIKGAQKTVKEKIIPEKTIKEKIIPEKTIKEKSDELKQRAKNTRESAGRFVKDSTEATVKARQTYNRMAKASGTSSNLDKNTTYYKEMTNNKAWRNSLRAPQNQRNSARSLRSQGMSYAQIAERLGISASQVAKYLKK